MKKFLPIPLLLFALLACQQTQVQPMTQNLGTLELRLDNSGSTKGQVARVKVSGLQTQGTLREADVTFTALTTVATQNDGAFDYVQAQFSVLNSSSTPFANLTLYAVAKSGNIAGTAIKSITNFGGLTDVNEQTRIAKLVTATHGLNISSTGASLISGREDMQLFTPNDVNALQADPALTSNGFSSNDKVLGYGFVARRCVPNCSSPTSFVRSIPAGQSGLITIALRIPRSSGTAYNFIMTFAVVDEPINRVTRSVYPPETLSDAESRLVGFGASSSNEIMQLGLARATTPSNSYVNQGTDFVAVSSNSEDYTALGLGRLSSGFDHSCALTAVGAAYCWGGNGFGQLGNNSKDASSIPVPVAGNLLFSSISAGGNTTCGLMLAGAAYCWGSNTDGGLGNNSQTQSLIPVPVSGGLVFSSIGVADTNTVCGLTTFGIVACWGSNDRQQLGFNSTVPRSLTPVLVAGGSQLFSSLSVGGAHSCGLTALGAAYCWGFNGSGQLGVGTSGTNLGQPTLVGNSLTFSSIYTGTYQTCALTSDGTAYCWGRNDFGQLGTANNTQSTSPVLVSGNLRFSRLDGGEQHTCGLTPTSTLYCWGRNNNGELGTGNTTTTNTPTLVGGGLVFAGFSTGWFHTCAITPTGLKYCWGSNTAGQIGNNAIFDTKAPRPVSGNLTFSGVYANDNHSCALTLLDKAYCWGTNGSAGLLGNNSTVNSPVPVEVSTTIEFSSLTSNGFNQTCGLQKTTGLAYCWGSNTYGQLGTGNTTRSLIPIAVVAPVGSSTPLAFSSLAAGDDHICGITPTQDLYCWGRDNSGQLGDGGTNTDSSRPVKIGTAFTAVTGGIAHTCAISPSPNPGSLYCWGQNRSGQLGDGTTVAKNIPTLIGSGFSSVSAGNGHTCAIQTISSVATTVCWGLNSFGQLGTGNNTISLTATPVSGNFAFSTVVVGENHTCGLLTNGTAYCWGDNGNGQIGNNNTVNVNTPALVSGNLSFSGLSASWKNTCGITTTNTAYCWGDNINGKIGFVLQTLFSTPTRDMALSFKL